MNTITPTVKPSQETKSSKSSKAPLTTASKEDTPFRADGNAAYKASDFDLQEHDQAYPREPVLSESILPPEARSKGQTVASKAPEYMENWREFCNGQVTDAHRALVKKHAQDVGIDAKTFDQLIERDPQNIQLLAQLI